MDLPKRSSETVLDQHPAATDQDPFVRHATQWLCFVFLVGMYLVFRAYELVASEAPSLPVAIGMYVVLLPASSRIYDAVETSAKAAVDQSAGGSPKAVFWRLLRERTVASRKTTAAFQLFAIGPVIAVTGTVLHW